MFNRIIYVLVLLACLNCISCNNAKWIWYKHQHEKSYDSEEEDQRRYEIFKENLKEIHEHNLKYEQGLETWTMALNKFADLTKDEFRTFRLGYKVNNARDTSGDFTFSTQSSADLPPFINWKELGAVTPVKDQENCASCWSFSATGAIEGQYFLKHGKIVSLSEQNLIDCSYAYNNAGCAGGFVDSAFDFARDYGIESEESYPYRAENGTCDYHISKVVAFARVRYIVNLTPGDELQLQEAVANIGPISVAIDSRGLFYYHGGVYINKNCSTTELDHAVLVVGYGTTNDGQEYWLVKNSWGQGWGESGYVRMARNQNNMCGIATKASYPMLE